MLTHINMGRHVMMGGMYFFADLGGDGIFVNLLSSIVFLGLRCQEACVWQGGGLRVDHAGFRVFMGVFRGVSRGWIMALEAVPARPGPRYGKDSIRL